ncbi:hypothetical protein H9P43_007175 [Blastocladiella emersonii ATCC 22665]|nr:hypothetical protein H9P43_007175 [Blastocladiella emersonii ATCC 22665]
MGRLAFIKKLALIEKLDTHTLIERAATAMAMVVTIMTRSVRGSSSKEQQQQSKLAIVVVHPQDHARQVRNSNKR